MIAIREGDDRRGGREGRYGEEKDKRRLGVR